MIQIGDHVKWSFLTLSFNVDTIISSIFVSLIIVFLALLAKIFLLKKAKTISSSQAFLEVFYLFSANIVTGVMGEKGKKYVPFVSTLFIFILFSNIFGLMPITEIEELFFGKIIHRIIFLESPTYDLNTTVALAICSFFAVQYYGIKANGLKYFKRFISPNFLFLPLNLLEELSRPMSLAIRLFGNAFGKAAILAIFVSLVVFPIFYPVPIMALGLFIAFLQAYIFSLLTSFYIYSAVSEEGH